jgi:hypothetical protein
MDVRFIFFRTLISLPEEISIQPLIRLAAARSMVAAGDWPKSSCLQEMEGKKRMEKRRDAINYRPAFGYLDITKCSGYAVLDGRI